MTRNCAPCVTSGPSYTKMSSSFAASFPGDRLRSCVLTVSVTRTQFAGSTLMMIMIVLLLMSSTTTTYGQSSVTNLCDGLITDKLAHPMTSVTKPSSINSSFIDPQFGTLIRRISNGGVTGGIIKPVYSTVPAWNADESYLILYHAGTNVMGGEGHHLYHGKSYAYIKKLAISPVDIEQFYWDTTQPDLLYLIESGNTLIRVHITTGTKDKLHTFSCNSVTGGSDPMFTSWSAEKKIIGLRCGNQIFTYNIGTGLEGTKVSVSGNTAPVASASGDLTFFSNDGVSEVRDANMNLLRTLPSLASYEHGSLGRLSNGVDTHNAVSYDGDLVGTLVTYDMTNGQGRILVGPSTGYPYPGEVHISALAFQNPGWVTISSVTDNLQGQNTLDQEILLVNTNPGQLVVCRVGHHRSYGKSGSVGYFAEPHPVISPSGTRILFGSDWSNSGSVDSYVIELPKYSISTTPKSVSSSSSSSSSSGVHLSSSSSSSSSSSIGASSTGTSSTGTSSTAVISSSSTAVSSSSIIGSSRSSSSTSTSTSTSTSSTVVASSSTSVASSSSPSSSTATTTTTSSSSSTSDSSLSSSSTSTSTGDNIINGSSSSNSTGSLVSSAYQVTQQQQGLLFTISMSTLIVCMIFITTGGIF